MTRPWRKAAVHILLGLYAAFTLTPVVYLLAASLKEAEDLYAYTFFPPPDRLTAHNYRKLFGSPAFGLAEVRDAGKLSALWYESRGGAPSPARRAWDSLAPAQQQLVARLARARLDWETARRVSPGAPRSAPPEVSRADREALRDALDRLLARRDFHVPDHFASLRLGWEAQQLLARPPDSLSASEVMQRNRLILEAAFPAQIAQNQVRIPFGRYVLNSLFVATTVVLVQVFFGTLGGFALAKYRFRGKTILTGVMLATMMIPAPVLLAPLYEQVFRLGLMDLHWGLIVPSAVSVFGLFLFRQTMLGLPDSLLEAARMDGCSEFGLYWRVAVPLSRPMIGAFTLLAFMGNWNSFLWPQIILHTRDLYTLPIGLSQLVGTQEQILGPLMAGTLLSVLPVIILFLLFQREFVSGLTRGAVKG